MIKACGELVEHFKRCELNPLLPISLKQQCDTRWNSVYDMLYSIGINLKQVEDILFGRKEHEAYMNVIDENLLKHLIELLSYFKTASEQLSADQEPTLHLVLPWINKLKNYCEIKKDDLPVMKQVKTLILEYIKEKIWLTQLHEISTFLHPTTKNLSVCYNYIGFSPLLKKMKINIYFSLLVKLNEMIYTMQLEKC